MADINGQHHCCSDCANFIANGDTSSLDLYGPEVRAQWGLGILRAVENHPEGDPTVEFEPSCEMEDGTPQSFLCDYCDRTVWSVKRQLNFAPVTESHVSTTLFIDGKELHHATFEPGQEEFREDFEAVMQSVGEELIGVTDFRLVTQFHNHAAPDDPDNRDACDCEIAYAPRVWEPTCKTCGFRPDAQSHYVKCVEPLIAAKAAEYSDMEIGETRPPGLMNAKDRAAAAESMTSRSPYAKDNPGRDEPGHVHQDCCK